MIRLMKDIYLLFIIDIDISYARIKKLTLNVHKLSWTNKYELQLETNKRNLLYFKIGNARNKKPDFERSASGYHKISVQ